MLLDLFTYLTTPCSPYIRRMGYLNEAIAMRDRYRRRRAAWQPHLDNTRQFVLSSADKCRNRNKLVIPGSGLLLDVPLEELSSMFKEVLLADVVCLPEVRRQIKRYGNVKFLEHDLTNIAEQLYKNKQYGIYELPEVKPASVRIYENADLVVSLNILSQLWVIPRAYAINPRPRVSPEQLDDWCRQIVESHYNSLQSMSCNVCLIADYEFVKRDREGRIFSRESTIFGLTLPKPDASWTWNIQPVEKNNHSKELIVGTWHIR